MGIHIDPKAIKTLMNGIFSCLCPVLEETERALCLEYKKVADRETVPIDAFIAAADKNPAKTPLHLFVEFCALAQEDPTSFHIGEMDLLRYFASRVHFDGVAMSIDLRKEFHPPSHIVGHMLLPVSIGEAKGNLVDAKFEFQGNVITLSSVYCPPDIHIEADGIYGFHLGAIVAKIDSAGRDMVMKHLSLIPDFGFFCGLVSGIDYSDYQGYGNYSARIGDRYDKAMAGSKRE